MKVNADTERGKRIRQNLTSLHVILEGVYGLIKHQRVNVVTGKISLVENVEAEMIKDPGPFV